MGNLFHLPNPCTRFIPICITRKPLQVVKMDGQILRFSEPLLLKELLLDFQGFGVKPSRSSNHLPQGFEVKLGRAYYLFPTKIQSVEVKATGPSTAAVKRIKVVMTKKQLQELLSNRAAPAKIVFGREKACCTDSAENWKPKLTSIPEEIELNPI